jgi:hypothetical protein
MPIVAADRIGSVELENVIQRRITMRTGGQIQGLHVSVNDDRIVITGCASCYYHKQLALQGALDTIADASGTLIQLDIEVISSLSRRNTD